MLEKIFITILNYYFLGNWELLREHSYYYQVQTQQNVCNLTYGDFVVWTKNGIAKERICLDRHFFEQLLESVDNFFIYGVLPEVIGKWYTRKIVADADGIVRVPVAARNEKHLSKC